MWLDRSEQHLEVNERRSPLRAGASALHPGLKTHTATVENSFFNGLFQYLPTLHGQ